MLHIKYLETWWINIGEIFKTIEVIGAIFEVLRAVLLKIQFFWNVRPCTLVNSKPYLEDSQYNLLFDHSVYGVTTLRNVDEYPPTDIPEISELRNIWDSNVYWTVHHCNI